MYLIEFGVTIPKDQVDPQLKSKLLDELPGIFNWALKGLQKWMDNGKQLAVPERVKKDTLFYRNEMDQLSKFLEDCCKKTVTETCSFKSLRNSYEEWCAENAVTPMSTRKMSPKLEQRGFKKYKSNGCVHWKGLTTT
jgi:putative DNA primase/helicase